MSRFSESNCIRFSNRYIFFWFHTLVQLTQLLLPIYCSTSWYYNKHKFTDGSIISFPRSFFLQRIQITLRLLSVVDRNTGPPKPPTTIHYCEVCKVSCAGPMVSMWFSFTLFLFTLFPFTLFPFTLFLHYNICTTLQIYTSYLIINNRYLNIAHIYFLNISAS